MAAAIGAACPSTTVGSTVFDIWGGSRTDVRCPVAGDGLVYFALFPRRRDKMDDASSTSLRREETSDGEARGADQK